MSKRFSFKALETRETSDNRRSCQAGFDVTPVLGVIPPDLPLVPNPGEVESWFEVPLSVLFDRANYTEQRAMWKGAERRYYEMHWEGYRIWGVTAAIIFNLSRRLDITESFGG